MNKDKSPMHYEMLDSPGQPKLKPMAYGHRKVKSFLEKVILVLLVAIFLAILALQPRL